LIACVPGPTAHFLATYPYHEVTLSFDAVAPMVYWYNRTPDADLQLGDECARRTRQARVANRQAFDASAQGGRLDRPPPRSNAFVAVAAAKGAREIVLAWQDANADVWNASARQTHFVQPLTALAPAVQR